MGVEPTQDWEASPATVLKTARPTGTHPPPYIWRSCVNAEAPRRVGALGLSVRVDEGLVLEDFVDLTLEDRLRNRADDLLGDDAVLEQEQGRDAADAEVHGRLRVGVDVELREGELAIVFLGELFYDGGDHLTGATPVGPEIDQDREVGVEY